VSAKLREKSGVAERNVPTGCENGAFAELEHRGPKQAQTSPTEAVWSTRFAGIGESKRKSQFTPIQTGTPSHRFVITRLTAVLPYRAG